MKQKVYIISESSHDYSQAQKYGDLIYLSTGKFNKLAVSKIYREFLDVLQNCSADDYILLSGLTVMSVIACCIIVSKHKKLNLLIYDVDPKFRTGKYKLRVMDFSGVR